MNLKILQFLTIFYFLRKICSIQYRNRLDFPPICQNKEYFETFEKTLVIFMLDRRDSAIFNSELSYMFKLFTCIFPEDNFFYDIIDYSSQSDWQQPFPKMKRRRRTQSLHQLYYFDPYTEPESVSKIDRIIEALKYFNEKRKEVRKKFNVIIYIPFIAPLLVPNSTSNSNSTHYIYNYSSINILENRLESLKNPKNTTFYRILKFEKYNETIIPFVELPMGFYDLLPRKKIDEIGEKFAVPYILKPMPTVIHHHYHQKSTYIYPEDRVNPSNNSWKSAFCISIGIGTFLLVIFTIFASFYIKKLGKLIENRLMEQGENQKKISEKKSEENVGKIRKKPSKTKKIAAKKRKTILDVDI
ncbi:unnamed protein product [Caenorhabditis angaria]|uniref:Protein BIG1 n=1 Tax=Caenorhabditis angaria TaxID=860376 RepID=A0A9P1N476_9PELO|nr:unnamed protein product [Caenorhabditis angaria]